MKKIMLNSLLASTAVFAVAAHAQSSVTLYGILDGGVTYESKTVNATGGNGGRFIGFGDSGELPSLFGLRGTEDLGDGLHAEFKLESGIDIGNGGYNNSNGNLFGREAYVGLGGGFGTVHVGLQYSPFFDTVIALDPRDLSQLGSSLPVYVNNAIGTGLFNTNAISYTSPVLAGLQGSLMFAPGGVAGNFAAGRQYSASLAYKNSGFGLFGAYYNGMAGGPLTSPIPTNLALRSFVVGGSVKLASVTAKASFTNYKIEGGALSDDVFNAGIDYMASPALDLNAGVWYIVNRDDTSSKTLMGAAGVTYSLSKRTAVYTQVGIVNNKGLADQGLNIGDAPTTLYAPKGTTVGANIGIRHMF